MGGHDNFPTLFFHLLFLSSNLFHISSSSTTSSPEIPVAEGEGVIPESETNHGGSEPEAEGGGLTQVCVFVTFYVIIIVIILVGNILVAMTIITSKNLHGNISNLYLLSLVTARASIAVFVIPARITGMFSEEYLGSILCRLCHYAAFGSSAASIFSIVAIAISKYLTITYEKKEMTLRTSIIIILLIWFFGFLYAIRAAVTNDLVMVETVSGKVWSCSTAPQYAYLSKYFILVDILCLFLIPLVIILFCYSRVINRLTTFVIQEKKGTAVKVADKQSMKAVRMLVILMLLFTVCTLLPMILNLYVLWGGTRFESYNVVETVVYMFSYSNSWFNLIVFAYFRDDLRSAFLSMVRKCPCCPGRKVTPLMVAEEEKKKEEPADPNKEKALRMMEF